MFERKTLYANVVNDRSAVYYTTGISKTDPFTNLDKVKINYLDGYEEVIIDGEAPVSPIDPQVCAQRTNLDFQHNCAALFFFLFSAILTHPSHRKPITAFMLRF